MSVDADLGEYVPGLASDRPIGQWTKTVVSASGDETVIDYRLVVVHDSDDPRAVIRREKHERGEDTQWVVDETWTVTPDGVSNRGGDSRD